MNDELIMRILLHPEASKCPIGTQSTMIHIFEEVIEEFVKERPYGYLSELLDHSTTE